MKDLDKLDSDAHNVDRMLKDADEMVWPNSPSDLPVTVSSAGDSDGNGNGDDDKMADLQEHCVSLPVFLQDVRYLPVIFEQNPLILDDIYQDSDEGDDSNKVNNLGDENAQDKEKQDGKSRGGKGNHANEEESNSEDEEPEKVKNYWALLVKVEGLKKVRCACDLVDTLSLM